MLLCNHAMRRTFLFLGVLDLSFIGLFGVFGEAKYY